MATPSYDINYDDKRFQKVESDKNVALSELEKTYGGMIENSDKYYQEQINASKDWADKQAQLQQQQTDFAIEKIEQQKEQAQKDYIKEQSGAYVDWQKQSDQYGANAEKVAAQGMQNTGYSESSQVSMYNAYQNRVAIARDAIGRAMLNFDNNIKDAQLQNSSVLAEIYAKAHQQQLELSLQGFQYKNTLLLEKADKKTQLDNTYYARYQDVLEQINRENALAEEVRQYNASLAQQQAALAEEQRQFDAQMAYQREKDAAAAARSSGGGGGSSGGSISKSKSGSSGSKSSSAHETIKKTEQQVLQNAKSSGSKSATIDMKSVLALGYGPISASRLAELEKQGLITSYTSGGQIKFKKSAYALKQSMLFK